MLSCRWPQRSALPATSGPPTRQSKTYHSETITTEVGVHNGRLGNHSQAQHQRRNDCLVAAKKSSADILVGEQVVGSAFVGLAAEFDDVAAVAVLQPLARVLLDHQHGEPELGV